MRIEQVQITPIHRDRIEVSAICDGELLYYRLPAARFLRQAIGDAIVASTIAPAMRAGTALSLPDHVPLSSHLAAQLDGIQRVYKSWNASLKQIEIDASLYQPAPASGPVGLFFAGGVDSSFSLLSHLDEVDVLIIVFGFDHTMSEVEVADSLERNVRFAERIGKQIVAVETNHSRFASNLGVSRVFMYGASLASIAFLLGLSRCYIASSHSSNNVRPDGSNPVLDHRFFNGVTEIIHDDVSVSRLAKTWAVAKRAEFLDNLRVCWELPNDNCGACAKCVRTMIALRLCDAEGPFPSLRDLRKIRTMATHSETEYVVDMLMAAHAKGDTRVERELRKGLRQQDFREALRYLDRALLGGRLRRLRRQARDTEMNLIKAEPRPDLDL